MVVSGQLHVPAALPKGKRPWYPLDRRLGGPHTVPIQYQNWRRYRNFIRSSPTVVTWQFLYCIIIIVIVISRIRHLGLFGFRIYFWNLRIYWTVRRTPWRGSVRHNATQRNRKTRIHIHSSGGIQTHDPSVRGAEDSTCLRPPAIGTCFLYCIKLLKRVSLFKNWKRRSGELSGEGTFSRCSSFSRDAESEVKIIGLSPLDAPFVYAAGSHEANFLHIINKKKKLHFLWLHISCYFRKCSICLWT